MKKIKIVIDIIMFIIMILLMSMNITGLQMHEILGVGIFAIFIFHKILNFKWIKSIGKNIFNKNMKTKSKVQFILDMLLFIFITANVVTGVLISKCILTKITITNIKLTIILHKFFAWWSLILISIHIGFHWKSVVDFFAIKCKVLKDNTIVKFMFKLFYVVIAIAGFLTLLRKNVYTNLIPIINNENNNEHNRDFEDIDSKLEQNEFDKERKYKNRPNNAEYPGEKKANRGGKNQKFEDNQDDFNDNSNTQAIALVDDTSSGGTPTLSEYLNKFTCSGCGKRCLLSNPQCGTGKSYQAEKTKEYNELYGNNESNNIQENNIDSSNKDIKKDNINEMTKANIRGMSIIDYISIMGVLIGGTYYSIEIFDKNKK